MDFHEEVFKTDRSQTLFGRLILQSRAAISLYEMLLSRHELRWICEIGTATGMLSTYFAVWGRLNKLPFLTIDNGAANWAWPLDDDTRKVLKSLGAEVRRGDCFKPPEKDRILEFIQEHPGLLFCDGGKKGRELREFGTHTSKGSIIIVHDYPIEVTDEDIQSVQPKIRKYEPWNTQSLANRTKAVVLIRQ